VEKRVHVHECSKRKDASKVKGNISCKIRAIARFSVAVFIKETKFAYVNSKRERTDEVRKHT